MTSGISLQKLMTYTGVEWMTYKANGHGIEDWNTRRPNDVAPDVRNIYRLYVLPIQTPVIGRYFGVLEQRNRRERSDVIKFSVNLVHHEYAVDSLSSFRKYKMEVSKVNLKLPTSKAMLNRAIEAASNQDVSEIGIRVYNGHTGSCVA